MNATRNSADGRKTASTVFIIHDAQGLNCLC